LLSQFTGPYLRFFFKIGAFDRAREVAAKEKREEFLLKAVQNNWIRVRRTGGMSSIECWELTDWTLARIQTFCKKINAWESDMITINEIAKKNSYPIRVKDLFSEDVMRLVSSKRIDSVLRKGNIQ